MTLEQALEGHMLSLGSAGSCFMVAHESGALELYKVRENGCDYLYWNGDMLASMRKHRSLVKDHGSCDQVSMTLSVAMEKAKSEPGEFGGIMVYDGSSVVISMKIKAPEAALDLIAVCSKCGKDWGPTRDPLKCEGKGWVCLNCQGGPKLQGFEA